MPGRHRGDAEDHARQIDLICAPQLMTAGAALAVHNGGYLKSFSGNAW
jgi:hypothetical protein